MLLNCYAFQRLLTDLKDAVLFQTNEEENKGEDGGEDKEKDEDKDEGKEEREDTI